ncbi:hypothetical protein Hanom_Chr17g01554821 [Helianthus anomalus]
MEHPQIDETNDLQVKDNDATAELTGQRQIDDNDATAELIGFNKQSSPCNFQHEQEISKNG